MNILKGILCFIIWLAILFLPLHIAWLNKKKESTRKWIRMFDLCFGWTIIGYLIALFLASKPNPPSMVVYPD